MTAEVTILLSDAEMASAFGLNPFSSLLNSTGSNEIAGAVTSVASTVVNFH